MATLQVRSVDDQLYKALGRIAEQSNRSISQQVVVIIKEYLSQPHHQKRATEDFLALCSTWRDARTADDIIEDVRKNRKLGARFKETF